MGWSKTEEIDWKEKVSWILHFHTVLTAKQGNGVATIHPRMKDKIVVAKNCRHCCKAWRRGIWMAHAWLLLRSLISIRQYPVTHTSQKSVQLCKAATSTQPSTLGWSYKVEDCNSTRMPMHNMTFQWASEKSPWITTQGAPGLIFLFDLGMRLLKM